MLIESDAIEPPRERRILIDAPTVRVVVETETETPTETETETETVTETPTETESETETPTETVTETPTETESETETPTETESETETPTETVTETETGTPTETETETETERDSVYEMQVDILYEKGIYYCLASEDLDRSRVKFGDLALKTESLATPALSTEVEEKYDLPLDKFQQVDLTVYAILKKLERYDSTLTDKYIESIRTGKKGKNISVAYDLESMSQSEDFADSMAELSEYKRAVESMEHGTIDMLDYMHKLKGVNGLGEEEFALYDKDDRGTTEIFIKMQKIIEDSKEGLEIPESRKAAAIEKMSEMARKRGIELPKGIPPQRMMIAITQYEIEQAKKSPWYIIPELILNPAEASRKTNDDTLGLTQEEIDNPDTIVDLLNNMDSSGQR